MAALTQALKLKSLMASDEEFIRYLEHLESSRTNRPLHQLAENTDALLEVLLSSRNTLFYGSSDTAELKFTGTDLEFVSGFLNLTFPGVLGDGATVAVTNSVSNAMLNTAIATLAGGVLAADCWLVVQVDRATTGAAIGVTAYQSTSAYITAMQAAPGAAVDLIPLAYCESANFLCLLPNRQWLGADESLRVGLREYISQTEFDKVHDNQVQNHVTFMTGDLVSGEPVQFSWDLSGNGTLTWDGKWYIKGRANTNGAFGPFDNFLLAGSLDFGAPTPTGRGRIAMVTLDKTDGTPDRSAFTSNGTFIPTSGRDDVFVFALWGDDDRLYLWDGTVIENGGSASLGGSVTGAAWYLSGVWDGSESMTLDAAVGGPPTLDLLGVAGPAQYKIGGHHIMVYVDGELQKGGVAVGADLAAQAADALSKSFRYFEWDDGSGIGTTLKWVSGVDPNGVTISRPDSNSFVEVYLPAGSSAGIPGKWQTVQILQLSGLQTEAPGAGVAATLDYTVAQAAGDATWYGLADHAAAYIEVDYDDGVGGGTVTSIGDGAGAFPVAGAITAGTYDPVTGDVDISFSPDQQVTAVRYYYLKADTDDQYQVNGAGNILPILPLGGLAFQSYYGAHTNDRTTLVMDGTFGGGVATLNTLSGAVVLAAADGTVITPGSPGAGDITIGPSDKVPLTGAGNGAAAGDALEAAFAAPAGAPATANPFVAADSALVGTTADHKAAFQGVLTAAPGLAAELPLVALEMLQESLRTQGLQVFVRPTNASEIESDFIRVDRGGSVVVPYKAVGRKLDLHVFRPTILSRTLASNVVGTSAASAGKWLWVYLVEQNPDTFESLRAEIDNTPDWLKYSTRAPVRVPDDGIFRGQMGYPVLSELGSVCGVPVGCFLAASSTTVYTNQSFDYDSGLLALGFANADNKFFQKTVTTLVDISTNLAPGGDGYLGLGGNSSRSLLPLDVNGYATHVRGVRIRVDCLPSTAASWTSVLFKAGNLTLALGDTGDAIGQAWFEAGGTSLQSRTLDLWLPMTDTPNGVRDYGIIEAELNSSGADSDISMYLEGVHFRKGFWSNS